MSHADDIAQADARVVETFRAKNPTVLLIGAGGQIGTDMTKRLLGNGDPAQRLVQAENLILAEFGKAYDRINAMPYPSAVRREKVDITDPAQVKDLIARTKPDVVINLAAVLSSEMKDNPMKGYDINTRATQNVIDAMHANGSRDTHPVLLVPSSIAACGADPKERDCATPQTDTFFQHTGSYGQTKIEVEAKMSGAWHFAGIRAVAPRLPVVASHPKITGIGTTDYSVDIFKHALRGETYKSPIAENLKLPVISGTDATRILTYALAKAISTPYEKYRQEMPHANHYNVPGVSMSPADMFNAARRLLPDTVRAKAAITYDPSDNRTKIASGWHARAEGAVFAKDTGFQLQHRSPGEFAAYMLQGYAANPDLVAKDGDSAEKKLEIERNCEAVLAHLAAEHGVGGNGPRR